MEEIAVVYARSLFEVAKDQDKLDDVREQLGAFSDALSESRELQVFFFSPYFSTPEKEDGLDRAVTDADPVILNFLKLLIEKHRMPVIFRIREQLRPAVGGREQAAPGRDHLGRRARRVDRQAARRSHRGADRPQGRALLPRGARHPGRHRRPGRQLRARRLVRNRLEQLRKTSCEGLGDPCRSSPTRSRPSSRAASRASTRARPTSPRSGPSSRSPTASPASTAWRTARRSRCSSCRTTSPASR